MRPHGILALAMHLALGRCAPTSPNNKRADMIFESAQASINDCGDSTFVNQSSGGSPKVPDCQQLAKNINGGGTWTIWPTGQHQLAQYGTCAFGAETDAGWANIGNQDIIDLINSSIQRFQWNGLVGSKGRMGCQGEGAETVDWGLYHT